MTKESIIELQKIDCNCNDCKHLLRNNYKKQLQDIWHEKIQLEEFNRERDNELFIGYVLREKTLVDKAFNKKITIRKPNVGYGYCKKFDLKEVSFIPNTCQLETQECYEHRRS